MASRLTPLCSVALRLSCALLLVAAATHMAAAQTINEPPALPVVIAVLPTDDAVEASGFIDTDTIDIELIRNGVTVASALGVQSLGGVLNVNVAPPSVCWTGTTPDIRPGDIVRFTSHLQNGDIHSIDQVHVMRLTAQRPVVIAPGTLGGGGIVEIHGTAADLSGLPISDLNLESRLVNPARFALNGKRTLRAGGGNVDGTLSFDLTNNPDGSKWTARYSNLTSGDVNLALTGENRFLWLGSIPANANELTIFQNSDGVAPGPLAGTCTAPLEPLDISAPTAPGTLTGIAAGPSGRKFTWSPSTDNVQVAGYELLRDGVVVGRVGPLVTTFTDTNIPAGAHAYTALAFDNASPLGAGATPDARIIAGLGQLWGNRSAASNTVNYTQVDLIAPTAPTTLSVATGNGKAMPTWSGATDNVGVVNYGVYRNNVLIATVAAPTTTYKDSGLVTGTYNYSVDAVDAVGLRSPRTANVPAGVIFIPDTTPPTVPGAMAATVSPDVHGRTAVLNWNTASDSMGVTGYRLFRNGVQRTLLGPNTLTFRDSALATGTYLYKVDAFDAANNHSALSAGATAVIANDPPLAPHALIVHPSRDGVTATGYPAAQGPYVFNLLRGAAVFTSAAIDADGSGLVQLNGAGGGCWLGTTPDLRAGDVLRITNAAGIAEQTTIANLTTQFAAVNGTTVLVHGTARDAAGNPLPLAQLEQRLIAASGVFDKTGSATLRASAAAGADGTLAYDAPGSTHWTASYTGLSAADMARAAGGAGNAAAESRGVWLGRTPATATEQVVFETGPSVNGGPAAGVCVTPAEAPVAAAAFFPASVGFGGVGAIPPAASSPMTVEIDNTGAAPMTIHAVYIAGLNANDFAITSASPPATLAPGAFFTVSVTFSPLALGARQATLCVSCDAAATTALSVPLSGTGLTDITAPTVPSNVTAVVSPDLHGDDVIVSWNAATDSVGVTGYSITRDGLAIATTGPAPLNYHDTNVTPATHVYRVAAFDLQANQSAASAAASVVIANDPPAAGHLLVAHPSRDWISGEGYAAANGPYVFSLFRGNKLFTSTPATADGSGLVQVNAADGACWNGNTPELRAGDVVRITDAAGLADQTTIADIVAGAPIAVDSATIVVHGSAADDHDAPLPLAQLEHRLVAAAGVFDKSGTATLRAGDLGDGAIAYDGESTTHWTATYTGLSAADVARATGGVNTVAGTLASAESQGVWLGRSPLAANEHTSAETGPSVMGGPVSPQCSAPVESQTAAAAALPAVIHFTRQGVLPATTSAPQAILVRNSGDAPMRIRDARITGLNAGDFAIVASDAPDMLAPHSFCTLQVAFSPSALGLRQAAVSLACDAANTSALSISLMGEGWDGLVIAAPGGPAQNLGVGSWIAPLAEGGDGERTLPVTIAWDASPSPQVTQYVLQQSVNGGPYADAPVQPGTALAVSLPLPLSAAGAPASYRFRVRAEGAGQMSEWVSGSSFTLEPVDDSNAGRLAYTGNWAYRSIGDDWGGGTHSTWSKVGVELRAGKPFIIAGSIAWITNMGPDCGMASVKVDDKDSVIVDLYSDTVKLAAVGYVATNLAAGKPHRMLVHPLAQGGPLASGGRVDMDAFIVVNDAPRTGSVAVDHTNGLVTQLPATPATLSFSAISPNPAVGRATLAFALPRDGSVRLDVMDLQGRLVQRLADGALPAGEHRVAWDGRTGNAAAHSGVYFAVLRFGEQTLVRRMIWMP